MKTNAPARAGTDLNNEGTRVRALSPIQELRRAMCACLLWEEGFYESGEEHAARVRRLLSTPREIPFEQVATLAREMRTRMKLRHAPLFLARELARRKNNGHPMGRLLADIIQRPDELTEFLAIYWKGDPAEKRQPLAKQVKVGLGLAFRKFSEHQLAKYNRDHEIKLRDVLFLCHAKPESKGQEKIWKRLVDGDLAPAETWEERLSAGAEKKATFEHMILTEELGALALLRNLRKMTEVGVDREIIRQGLANMKVDRVLPFRFIAAAKYAPQFEADLEKAMFRCLTPSPREDDTVDPPLLLEGKTALVVDTSPSMWMAKISERSEMNRFEAAAALAILCREICEDIAIYAFNERCYEVAPRRGFALRDALEATRGQSSRGGLAVEQANKDGYDRIIVLTDGEWHYSQGHAAGNALRVSPPPATRQAYMLNVATTRNGVGYGPWTSIDGWSESVIEYIRATEEA